MSIAYVTDGVTDLDSALFNPWIDAMNGGGGGPIQHMRAGIYNVLDYDAEGDGVTDDTDAVRGAIAAATAAEGGVILFPGGGRTYLCNDITEILPSGTEYIFAIGGDNLTFRLEAGATIRSTAGHANSVALFYVSGLFKPEGPVSDFIDHWYGEQDAADYPIYEIDPATEFAGSVTTTTAADAGEFVAGDLIYIRTGQTINATPGTTEPDAEINIVTSVNATTGVITLQYPLSKPYAQEYYVVGTADLTSTAVTANPAPLGVQNITAATLRNIVFEGDGTISFHPSTGSGHTFRGGQILGFTVRGLTFDLGNAHLQNMGLLRFGEIDRIRCNIHSTVEGKAWVSGSTGVNDLRAHHSVFSSSGLASQMHMAEGNTDIIFDHNTVEQSPVSTSLALFSSGSRGRRIHIDYNKLVHDGEQLVQIPAAVTGGSFIGNEIWGSTAANISAVAFRTHSNEFLNGAALSLLGDPTYSLVQTTSVKVAHDAQTVSLGTIPAAFRVHSVAIRVITAFNSDGTDQISVGFTGTTEAFATLTDVSTTGNKTVTLGSAPWQNDTARELVAYYVNGGTEPSAGAAIVEVVYSHPRRNT
jgi:hypothetical protein